MKTLNPSNHNVANTFGDQSNIVTFNTTINNDITPLLLQLEERDALIEKQNFYINLLRMLLKRLWTSRR